MSLREKLKNPFVQQYLIEIILPLIGYFLFDWSITIIAVFYLVDQLASEALFFRRLHWIQKSSAQSTRSWIVPFSICIFILLFSTQITVMTYFWLEIFAENIHEIDEEVWTFAKEELWLLVPVVGFLYHFKDQLTFYMPRRYLNYSARKTFIYRNISSIALLILSTTGLLIWNLTRPHEIVILFIFIGVKILFDQTIGKWANKRSMK